jgi:hypothetical protein
VSIAHRQLTTALPRRDVTRRIRCPQGPERFAENGCAADGASLSPDSPSSPHIARDGLIPADFRSMRISAVAGFSDQFASTASILLVVALDGASHGTTARATATQRPLRGTLDAATSRTRAKMGC